jgi:hypothetical protein
MFASLERSESAPEAATAAVAGSPFAMRSSAVRPGEIALGYTVIDLFRLLYRINQ